jgi:hypothetical protein
MQTLILLAVSALGGKNKNEVKKQTCADKGGKIKKLPVENNF